MVIITAPRASSSCSILEQLHIAKAHACRSPNRSEFYPLLNPVLRPAHGVHLINQNTENSWEPGAEIFETPREGGIGIWQITQEGAILSVNATLLRSKGPTAVRHDLN
jgi:hypothetical protein